MENEALEDIVKAAYGSPDPFADPNVEKAVRTILARLDNGTLRVAEPDGDGWRTNAWVKQGILLFFALAKMEIMEVGPFRFYDKIPLKQDVDLQNVRVVPPGTVRYGSFLEPGCIVMPGYVNIGAWVGGGTMVDTWATVGSCAQIGRHVHLSGGVGIGGVLEPAQASPVIVEDNAFIGSRCIVVEGVRVKEGAVLGAGVVLTASTPIIDTRGKSEVIHKGVVPARCVVIPGTKQKTFPSGNYQVPCALIIGERSAKTDSKTSLTDVLRQFELPV